MLSRPRRRHRFLRPADGVLGLFDLLACMRALLGETPGGTDAPGPALGAHTEEVLGRLLGLKPPFDR